MFVSWYDAPCSGTGPGALTSSASAPRSPPSEATQEGRQSLMTTKHRSIAVLGAAGALAGPALALADEPATPAATDTLHAELGDALTVRADMRGHLHDRLLRRHRRLARAAGERNRDARFMSNGDLRRESPRLRRELRARESAAPSSTAGAGLQAIAACESGGDPHAVGGGGAFRGKYQFTYQTWAAVGGSGDPASAPEAEQDRRAAQLMATSGRQNWPVCGS